MTVTREHVNVGAICGGIGYLGGLSAGVLIGGWSPDVVVAAIAGLVLVVWTAGALYAGWRVAMHNIANRLDQLVQTAVQLEREGEQIRLAEALAAQRAQLKAEMASDTDALIEATKEDR